MGGSCSAESVREHVPEEVDRSRGARAEAGNPRVARAHGDMRPVTPPMGPVPMVGDARGTTPLLGALPRPALHVHAPVTPDTRMRHPDIVDPAQASNAHAFLESERARLSIPETPTGDLRDVYPHFCPICFMHFKEVWKTHCCSNHICIACALAHVRTRARDPAASGWCTLPVDEVIDGVACPTCNTDGVRFSHVRAVDQARSYQESPHTRDLFAAMEARNRALDLGVAVSSRHIQPNTAPPRADVSLTYRAAPELSDTASMRAVRNHPVAHLRRDISDPGTFGGDFSLDDQAGPAGAHVSVHYSDGGEECEVEHDEDNPLSQRSGATPPAVEVPPPLDALRHAHASSRQIEVVLGYSADNGRATSSLSARHPSGAPIHPTVQSASVATASTIEVAKRPDTAPQRRTAAGAAENTVKSARIHRDPLISTAPASTDADCSQLGTATSSAPPVRHSSDGRDASTDHRRLIATRGWADERSAPDDSSSSSSALPPPVIRVVAQTDDEEQKADLLFLPSPHARGIKAGTVGPSSRSTITVNGSSAHAAPGHAVNLSAELDALSLDSTAEDASAAMVEPDQTGAASLVTCPSTDHLLEESISFDGSSSFASNRDFAHAAVHPMPRNATDKA